MKIDNVAFLLLDVARLFRRRFDERTRRLGITGPQMRTLLMIGRHPGINQGVLADLLDVEPITTCRMVDRLEQAGLVERRRDPDDRRVWQLHLSVEASPIADEMKGIGELLVADSLTGLDDAAQGALIESLNIIRDNLNGELTQTPNDRKALSNGRG